MPKDKIDTAIKKGTGELEGVEYVESATRATASAARRSWSTA
jgi:transcriptional/translational regulatory protein YebC/TACO1